MQYASFAGIVGVVVYAISCGLPILLISFFGGKITRDMPHVFSLADFVGWRYGPTAKTVCAGMLVACCYLDIFVLWQ
jgi:Na+/proline symporter